MKNKDYEKMYFNSVKKNINSNIIQKWRTRQNKVVEYLENLPKEPNRKILELGSGRGFFVKELKNKGFNVIGSDFNQMNLELAKKINKISLKKIDAENINLNKTSFDIVISVELIEHLLNLEKHLISVKKILKPRGIYIISTPNFFMERIFNFVMHKKPDKYHVSSQTHSSLKKLLERYGFSVKFLKINQLTDGQKDKLKILSLFYPVQILPKFLQPSIICIASLGDLNELA
ncbi:MAG: class I SAM-dependent methyltransferase [archaeon]